MTTSTTKTRERKREKNKTTYNNNNIIRFSRNKALKALQLKFNGSSQIHMTVHFFKSLKVLIACVDNISCFVLQINRNYIKIRFDLDSVDMIHVLLKITNIVGKFIITLNSR